MKKIGMKKPHTNWLKITGAKIQTVDGVAVAVYELTIDHAESPTLTAWAKHFREHYCLDSQIDRLRRGTKKSREQYLLDLVFPDKLEDFGPATRSGDFAEILIADLLESQMSSVNYFERPASIILSGAVEQGQGVIVVALRCRRAGIAVRRR